MQIRRLEDRLGGTLLIRRSGGLHLTPAGDLLLQQSRLLIADADAAERITRLALQGEAGMLRVGFGVAVLARGLPEVIMRFRRRFPEVHLSVKNMSTSDQLQALSGPQHRHRVCAATRSPRTTLRLCPSSRNDS